MQPPDGTTQGVATATQGAPRHETRSQGCIHQGMTSSPAWDRHHRHCEGVMMTIVSINATPIFLFIYTVYVYTVHTYVGGWRTKPIVIITPDAQRPDTHNL